MFDVLTGNFESEGNDLALEFAQPTVPTTTVVYIPDSGSFAYSSDWVNRQEDDEMANGEGSDGHVPIENIEVLDRLKDGAWVGVRE
jgi:hypothetical protein